MTGVPPVLRTTLAATAATLVGIGLARFAYAPLLPVLIVRGWFAPGAAAYLGAANLLGYLAGALAARRVAGRFRPRRVIRGAMLAAAASLAACCQPAPFGWFFLWRLVSGVAGGLLMILAPSAAMAAVPAQRRGRAGGLVLTGVGLGIAASGTLVPLLLRWGLTAAWLGLAALATMLTALAWREWPDSAPPAPAGNAAPGRFAAVSASYGLCAVGLVPHMVFLVDYAARGLGLGLAAGASAWVVLGAGALCGPVLAGRVADRFGPAAAMRTLMAAEAGCLLLLFFGQEPVALGVSAAVGGAIVPAITAVMLGRVAALAGPDAAERQKGWTAATIAWAVGQAAGAYGLAALYGRTGDYRLVIATALSATLAAAAVEARIALAAAPRPPTTPLISPPG